MYIDFVDLYMVAIVGYYPKERKKEYVVLFCGSEFVIRSFSSL